MSTLSTDAVRAAAVALRERIVEIRRAIHRRPELGLETPETQRLVLAELARAGIEDVKEGMKCTSVVAEIVGTGGAPSRCVALRADMDALPMVERSGLPFSSARQGRMHSCGHDAHTAMLLGAAEILNAHRSSFAGRVRLLFQPGEEGFGGAKLMIEEGALEGVDRAFAIHVDPSRAPHSVWWRSKTILAGFDNFRVVFCGAGGHASTPHAARDPIPAIGPFVDGLSHVAAREADPDDRVVLTVTRVRAGTADNVIPSEAECVGTIRSLSAKSRAWARDRLPRLAEAVAASRGLEAQVELTAGYPPTENDADTVSAVTEQARSLGLVVREMASPFMGAEDFSYVLEQVSGALVFLGGRVEGCGPLHSDVMRLDEDVLATGAALHVLVALRLLADAQKDPVASARPG